MATFETVEHQLVCFKLAPHSKSHRFLRVLPDGQIRLVASIVLDKLLNRITPQAHPHRKRKPMYSPFKMQTIGGRPAPNLKAKLTWSLFLGRYAAHCHRRADYKTEAIATGIMRSLAHCRVDDRPLPFPEKAPRNIIEGLGQFQLALIDVPVAERSVHYDATWRAALALRDRLESK